MMFVFCSRHVKSTEWTNTLNELGVPFHRFHDKGSKWYMEDHWPQEVADAVKKHGHPTLSFGSSMGAWGALYFQPIIQAKCVLAFTPQGTTHWKEMRAMPGKKNVTWSEGLEGYPGARLPKADDKSVVFYGRNLCDSEHKKIAIAQGYTITDVDTDSHNTAEYFKEKGMLIDIIRTHYKP
jgi:hypothetical protein